jgi:hypothetical protein
LKKEHKKGQTIMFPLFKGGYGVAERDFNPFLLQTFSQPLSHFVTAPTTPLSQATFPLKRGKQRSTNTANRGAQKKIRTKK